MGESQPRVRLRQAVLVASEIDPVAASLRSALGLSEPFHDPGVGEFGLSNAVFAIGDCFLEVISPLRPDTAAGRYLARHGGDGGYMVIFDLEDLDSARGRAERSGVRVVWQLDLPDISGTHLHPADMRGAIVSLDQSRPYGTWRWGGPEWTERTGAGAAGRLAGVTIAVQEPIAVAARWAQVLGVPLDPENGSVLTLSDAEVRFVEAAGVGGEGLVEIAVEHSPALEQRPEGCEIGGVRMRAVSDAGD